MINFVDVFRQMRIMFAQICINNEMAEQFS